MSVDTGEAARPESPLPKPRPLVGPLLCFIAVMAIIGHLSLVTLATILIIAFTIRAIRRRRTAVGRPPAA